MSHVPARSLLSMILTLAGALAGGLAFRVLGLPAPFLSGSMLGAIAVGIAGVDLYLPLFFRNAVMLVTGASMGSAMTPATLQAIIHWPASLVILAVTILGVIGSALIASRPWNWDRNTAIYAAAPGAFSSILLLAEESGANVPRVVVTQSLRILILVSILPTLVVLFDPQTSLATPVRGLASQGLLTGPFEYVAIIAAGLSGAAVCFFLRFPAALLIGACIGNAVLHGSNLVSAPVPQSVLLPCYVLLGAFMALRFKGTGWADIKADLGASTAIFVSTSLVSLAGALLVHLWLGIPFAATLVAFAPGGIEAMIIMAFALGVDVAYVGTHHLVRFAGISLLLPLAMKTFARVPFPRQ